MESIITVVLADDHTIVRQGFKYIIGQNPRIKVVGEAANGEEAFALVESLKPHILVSDISMPKMSGIEVAKKLVEQKSTTRILFLTMQDSEEYIMEAMQAGALGFLPKETVSEDLVKGILQVAQGKEYFSELIYNKAFKALRSANQKVEIKLTPREKEILQLLAKGLNTKIIADKLFVSEYTVSNHRANLLRKLSAQNVAELIRKAAELKLLM